MISRREEANNYLDASGIRKEIFCVFPGNARLANTIIRAAINRYIIGGELEDMGKSAYDVLVKMEAGDRNVGEKSMLQIQQVIDLMKRKPNKHYLTLSGLAIKKNKRYKTIWAFARIDVSL